MNAKDPTPTTGRPEEWATGLPAILSSISRTVPSVGPLRSLKTLAVINQPNGFDCPGCAWPEAAPGERHVVEFCESGAKAVAEEATRARVNDEFFERHSLVDLAERSDFWLGQAGRLTRPMIKRPEDTHYRPIGWSDAFDEIAHQLTTLASPDEAVFYTSGRTSNEAAFAYQLMVRCFGTNNLPDCSNMCHEPTSFALAETLGEGKGSVRLEDFVDAEVIVLAGQNPGTNHPRMLTTLEEAKRAGAKIIAINPLPEAGLLRFKNPQHLRGLVGHGTKLADVHLPVRLGGDHALFQLFNKWMCQQASTDPATIDREFVAGYTAGFDQLSEHLAQLDEATLVAHTGLDLADILGAFEMLRSSKRTIICWAMGITQHLHAMDTIKEFTNFALLGGHIGRRGAGLCPIRGHSNVQGDRTMGIFERPKPELLSALEAEFEIPMPTFDGLDTIDAIGAFARGEAKVFVGLGGNFVRAAPDPNATEGALAGAQLTVQISTKLNRSHVVGGETAIILPTFGRTDADANAVGVEQFVTVEDSMGLVHRSIGRLDPPSEHALSEVAIICKLATAIFGESHKVPWAEFAEDYDVIRDRIAHVIPGFENFNERVRQPGGFELPHPPRDERRFPTDDGKAHFSITEVTSGAVEHGGLLLQTLRSHDQYNTTIYGHDDRYRGLKGDRHIIMINPADLVDLGFVDGDLVDIFSLLEGPERRASGFRVVSYPTPAGCAAAYFPETNVLLSLDHHGASAQTPAAKAIPIRLERVAVDVDRRTLSARSQSAGGV